MSEQIFFCVHCGVELNIDDVDANLDFYGVFKCECSVCMICGFAH